MAGADAGAHAGRDELQALTALNSEHAPHSTHHNCAVAAACDGGILQGSQGIDDAVMAVCDAQHTIREVILPFGYRAFADALDINNPTYTSKGCWTCFVLSKRLTMIGTTSLEGPYNLAQASAFAGMAPLAVETTSAQTQQSLQQLCALCSNMASQAAGEHRYGVGSQ